MKVRRIYFAGPLFTSAERLWNQHMADYLRFRGYKVFLPQEEEPREKTAKSIFEMDVKGIDWCDCVVAVMDGPDPDSGTSWEVGYAYAKGKLIFQVRTDFRASGEGGVPKDKILAPYNIMLSASADGVRLLPFATAVEVANSIVDFLKDYQ